MCLTGVDETRPTEHCPLTRKVKSLSTITRLSVLSPGGGVGEFGLTTGRLSHGNLMVRSVPRVRILIVRGEGLKDI